jgi:hypothetical protein
MPWIIIAAFTMTRLAEATRHDIGLRLTMLLASSLWVNYAATTDAWPVAVVNAISVGSNILGLWRFHVRPRKSGKQITPAPLQDEESCAAAKGCPDEISSTSRPSSIRKTRQRRFFHMPFRFSAVGMPGFREKMASPLGKSGLLARSLRPLRAGQENNAYET